MNEEEPTSEATKKKQRKTRSDKKYQNEEERREARKEVNRKSYAKRIGVVKSTEKQPGALPRISRAVPHLDEVTAVYCRPTARHIEKFSNTNALEWVTLDGKNFEDFVEEIIEKLNEESEKVIVLGRVFFADNVSEGKNETPQKYFIQPGMCRIPETIAPGALNYISYEWVQCESVEYNVLIPGDFDMEYLSFERKYECTC